MSHVPFWCFWLGTALPNIYFFLDALQRCAAHILGEESALTLPSFAGVTIICSRSNIVYNSFTKLHIRLSNDVADLQFILE